MLVLSLYDSVLVGQLLLEFSECDHLYFCPFCQLKILPVDFVQYLLFYSGELTVIFPCLLASWVQEVKLTGSDEVTLR